MNGRKVFVDPSFMVAAREPCGVIYFDGQPDRTAWPRLKLQPRIGLPATSDDGHDGPVTPTKDARKRLFINGTRPGAVPRMGMYPEASELFWPPTKIDLSVEILGHRVVIEGDSDGRAELWDQDELLDQQEVVGCRDPESANFGLSHITQEQEFGPRCRAESQRRSQPFLDRMVQWTFPHDNPRREIE